MLLIMPEKLLPHPLPQLPPPPPPPPKKKNRSSLLYSIDDCFLSAKSIHALCQMQCDPKKFKKETDVLEILRKIAADRGFVVNGNSASGYSMFYVLSEQLQRVKGTQIAHGELRKTLVEFLRNSPKLVSQRSGGFITKFNCACTRFAKNYKRQNLSYQGQFM